MELINHSIEKDEEKGEVHLKARLETTKKGPENVRITVKIEDLHNTKQHCEFKVHSETLGGAIGISVDTFSRVYSMIQDNWEGDHLK